MTQKSEKWIDENGKYVVSHSFFSRLYEDTESRQLSKKYNMYFYHGQFIPSSLASTERESFMQDLLTICKIAGGIRGFQRDELEAHEPFQQSWLEEREYLRLKKVKGIEVLFPTEKLLINQKVKKSSGD